MEAPVFEKMGFPGNLSRSGCTHPKPGMVVLNQPGTRSKTDNRVGGSSEAGAGGKRQRATGDDSPLC